MAPPLHTLLVCLGLCAAAAGQDLRDRVELKDGSEVRGRVVTPFAPDEVLVVQGGKRVRVPREQIDEIRTITLDIATVLDKRRDAKKNARFHWMIAEWAATKELHAMARLQVLTTVLLDPTHAEAHAMLGHREHPRKGWLWPVGSRWMTLDEAEEHHSKWGRALELESEHFSIRTNAGYAAAVDTLVDLEQMYVFLLVEYGEALQLREAVDPMKIAVYRDEESFPARSEAAIPYFEPRPFTDTGWTFVRTPGARPFELFTVGTQMVLYRCLANDVNVQFPQDRLCAWAELGFGRFVQSRLSGDPGAAEAGPPVMDAWELDLARNFREYRLPNLLHLTLRDHFYGTLRGGPNVHWASAHAFVQFLMDPTDDPKRPGRFLEFLRLALRQGKGDSSSAFDDALGTRVEELEAPFDAWLGQHGAPRRN